MQIFASTPAPLQHTGSPAKTRDNEAKTGICRSDVFSDRKKFVGIIACFCIISVDIESYQRLNKKNPLHCVLKLAEPDASRPDRQHYQRREMHLRQRTDRSPHAGLTRSSNICPRQQLRHAKTAGGDRTSDRHRDLMEMTLRKYATCYAANPHRGR